MEQSTRNMLILGVILTCLGVVVLLGFNIFSVSKETIIEGSIQNQSNKNDFINLSLSQYNDTIVTGREVLSFYNYTEGKDLALLVNNSKMNIGSNLKSDANHYYHLINDLPYVNYASIISNDTAGNIDTVYLLESKSVFNNDENSMLEKDGSIISNGFFCLDDDGIIIRDGSISNLKISGTVEYIDVNSKFEAKYIVNELEEVIGVCFTQLRQ